jgi:uncharacterized MAPEG superfamily protein
MHHTELAFAAYIGWILLLLIAIGMMRTVLVLRGKRYANSFKPSGEDVSAFSNRLCRAHANCYEGFPIFGGLMILALATNNQSVTDGLAYWMLGARICQSVTHLFSTRNLAVFVRFTFMLVQIVIAIIWIVGFFYAFH